MQTLNILVFITNLKEKYLKPLIILKFSFKVEMSISPQQF